MTLDPLDALGQLVRQKAFWVLAAAVAVPTAAIVAPRVYDWARERPSRKEVHDAIKGAVSASAPGRYVAEVKAQGERIAQLEEQLKELHRSDADKHKQQDDQIYQEIWYRVGLTAADAEPDHRKRASAAREARDRFDRLRLSHDLETAARMALEPLPPGYRR